jgi:hypothetical protein
MSAPRKSHPLPSWLAPAAFGAALAAVGLVALPPKRAAEPTPVTACEEPLPRRQPSGETNAGPRPSEPSASPQATPMSAPLASQDAGKSHIEVGAEAASRAASIVQSRERIPEKPARHLFSRALQEAARPLVLIRRDPARYGAPEHAAPAASSSQSLATQNAARRKMWLCPPMEPRPLNPWPRATPAPQSRAPPRPLKRTGPTPGVSAE